MLRRCFKERGALGIEDTNVGTIQEMVVLVNPKCGYMVSVKAVGDATDLQVRIK